ncbi:hypothetical protein ACU4HD_07585 [Cupriavidus basilensis]
MDKQTPDIGYMPGPLRWFFGEKLAAMGVEIVQLPKLMEARFVTGNSSPVTVPLRATILASWLRARYLTKYRMQVCASSHTIGDLVCSGALLTLPA